MKTYDEITRIKPSKEDIKNTKEFLLSIGWLYNPANGIFYKKGLKDENGKFIFEKDIPSKKRTNKFSDETVKKIIRLRKSGFSFVKIGQLTGVSKSEVFRIIKKLNVKIVHKDKTTIKIDVDKAPLVKKKDVNEEIKNTMIQLRQQGYSFRKIRRKTGVSITQVRKSVKNIEFNAEDKIIRNAKIPQETIKKIIELHKRGYNNAFISRTTGVSQMAIINRIRKYEYENNEVLF